MKIPGWVMGGIVGDIADFCGWRLRPVDETSHIWSVQTRESVHGEKPELLTLTRLATSRNHQNAGIYSRLNRLRRLDHVLTDELASHGRLVHESIAEVMGDHVSGLLASIRVLTQTARDVEDLREVVQESLSTGLLPKLPNASVLLLEISEILPKRYQVVRALLPTEMYAKFRAEGGRAFRAAKNLFDDTTIGLGSYLDVLMTSLAPDPWGMAVGRPGGAILYLFGQRIVGRPSVAADPIMLFGASYGYSPSVQHPKSISADSFDKATRWWVEQLEILFSIATEPANYAPGGLYDPQLALEKILSLEQYFRACQSIAIGGVDQHGSRLIMFSALETLGGLSGRLKWDTITSAANARGVLAELANTLPPNIHDVLLPRARSAVRALERIQDGFFLPERLVDGGLRLPTNQGHEEVVPLDKAASLWLRVIRNSHHGFDQKQTLRSRALLSSHDGDLPEHLPDLAWLYLLALMANPDYLRRHAPVIISKK